MLMNMMLISSIHGARRTLLMCTVQHWTFECQLCLAAWLRPDVASEPVKLHKVFWHPGDQYLLRFRKASDTLCLFIFFFFKNRIQNIIDTIPLPLLVFSKSDSESVRRHFRSTRWGLCWEPSGIQGACREAARVRWKISRISDGFWKIDSYCTWKPVRFWCHPDWDLTKIMEGPVHGSGAGVRDLMLFDLSSIFFLRTLKHHCIIDSLLIRDFWFHRPKSQH
jgi:hypothetical protein